MIDDLTRRIAVNGVELAWDEWGEGSGHTLLLCHGFSGSAHDFALNVPALAAGRRVVVLDHRGHGLSTKLRDTAGYSIDQLVADLIAFIEATCDGPIDLLGHSMGGRMSMQLAVERPDLVRSLIAMDTSAWQFVSDDPARAALYRSFFEGLDPARGLPNLDALPNPETALIEAATPALWRDRKEMLSAGFDPYAAKALGGELMGDTGAGLRLRLGEIRCSVTVLAGSNDHPFVDQVDALPAETGGGRVCVIPGAYHSPQLTHAGEWHAALIAHLTAT